jgi:hypothetical protein
LRRENAEVWLFEIESGIVRRKRATLTHVIARLDRATEYSGPSESYTNGSDYWFPAFAGMTVRAMRESARPSASLPEPKGTF